jgi:hypothetical protein
MTTAERILTVAHDAGGARAIIPVARELQRRNVAVLGCVAGPAATLWPSECPEVHAVAVPDSLSLADAVEVIRRDGATGLLSASGLYNDVEHTFRLAARLANLPSVAVLDSWLNYGERFERVRDGARVASRPDLVCAIDTLSYRGLLEAGFAPEQLCITGAPNLEWSMNICTSAGSERRASWRAVHALRPEDLVVVFFSEPFITGPSGEHFEGAGALLGSDGRSFFGYTATEILDAALSELVDACERSGRRCQLIVKPHPAEHWDPLRTVMERHRSPAVEGLIRTDGTAAEWIGVADVLVGMMTIALLEAALAGKPALSVQIGLPESGAEDPCMANALGYTHPIFDREALRRVMRQLCEQGLDGLAARPREPLPISGATERVATALLSAVGAGLE